MLFLESLAQEALCVWEEKEDVYPWALSETPVASAIKKPPLLVLWE